MTKDCLSELSVSGTLRVAINMGNSLLVTGQTAEGDPDGVAPDVARELARRLGVDIDLRPFPMPGDIADAMAEDAWDVALIAIEPKRAEMIAFSAPYAEIEATYLVAEHAPFQSVEEVDRQGVRIAVPERAAFDLYLTRTLTSATLCRAIGQPGAADLFQREKLEALAGLAPALRKRAAEMPGTRLLPGRFTTINQAVGTKHANKALHAFIEGFISDIKSEGLVPRLIDKHGVTGNLGAAP